MEAVELVPKFRAALQAETPGTVARKVGRRIWSNRTFLVLRCDLAHLADRPAAKIPVRMQRVQLAEFTGFRDELPLVSGSDFHDLVSREKMRVKGFDGLYTAFSDVGEPVFSQWLMRPDQPRVADEMLRRPLSEDEVLIEGAYTFSRFRGLGAMRAGMHQLLEIARDEGYRWALTGVGDDNIPSLKGCYRVGFDLDYVERSTGRLGRYQRRYSPPAAEDVAAWRAAVGL